MIAELGHFLLWLALGVSLVLGVVPLWGAQRGHAVAMGLARPATGLLFGLVLVSTLCLVHGFVTHDFSVLYVASHSNTGLPIGYRIAGLWGGHEGSLLLWMLMQVVWMLAVARFSKTLPLPVLARILSVMGWVCVGFLLFTLVTSNPFDRLWPAPADGRDLNPLLQDIGMVIHPPMLYMGYVGFSVAFAFAVAALIGGNLDAQWARWTRPWTTAAWFFLTIGIALGSWWAYYELGWGGWWFWDPVENASFMPWLVGTALIHSLAVTEKRGSFKNWTVLMAILAFSLSLVGTFLVRSGVLSSVHAFATDPSRGLFILAFLVVVIGASLTLYAWRAPSVGLGARFALVSRESMLLGNNVMLVVACAAVLLGTLYPLLLDALNMGKISVGPPYFDAVYVPLMVPVVFLMGIGPLCRWKEAEVPDLARRLRWAAVVTVVASLLTGWMAGHVGVMTSVGLGMGFWIASSIATDFWEKTKPLPGVATWAQRVGQLPRAHIGMMVAHLGVAAFIFGVTMVRSYEVERDVQLTPEQSVQVGDYSFKFLGVREFDGANYRAVQGGVEVSRGGQVIAQMLPEKRIYRVQTNPMTEAAIRSRLTGDLYVSLGEPVGGKGAWILRVYIKPFITWIWGGCFVMALGGAIAASDRRYRQANKAARDAYERDAHMAPGPELRGSAVAAQVSAGGQTSAAQA
jgi:cytochrome c-type biogenesis protein CcmF